MSGSGSVKKVVLVTGANRGIGLGLVRELIRRGGCSVVATCRTPSGAPELRELLESGGQGCGFVSSNFLRGTFSIHKTWTIPIFIIMCFWCSSILPVLRRGLSGDLYFIDSHLDD